jgi:hypothetical protein
MLENASSPFIYYPYIIVFSIAFGIIQLLIYLRKKNNIEYQLLNEEDIPEELLIKGDSLRMKYMLAFLLAKGAMWAKAPYSFMLFSTFHQLSVGEIGILYMIDAVMSLLTGPFLGFIADTFGRKSLAIFYPINTIIVLYMRMSGNIPLAYIGQFIHGSSCGILATCFEAWVNYEIAILYIHKPIYMENYRKKIFQNVMFYDSLLSLTITIVTAIIYVSNLILIYRISLEFLLHCI